MKTRMSTRGARPEEAVPSQLDLWWSYQGALVCIFYWGMYHTFMNHYGWTIHHWSTNVTLSKFPKWSYCSSVMFTLLLSLISNDKRQRVLPPTRTPLLYPNCTGQVDILLQPFWQKKNKPPDWKMVIRTTRPSSYCPFYTLQFYADTQLYTKPTSHSKWLECMVWRCGSGQKRGFGRTTKHKPSWFVVGLDLVWNFQVKKNSLVFEQ